MKATTKKKLIAAVLALIAVLGAAALTYQPLLKWYRKAAKLPDENGMYQIGEHWFQVLEPLSDQAAQKFANKLISIQENYLTDQNQIFWAVVPDKGWYAKDEGYPTLDHVAFQEELETLLPDFTAIDLTN